MSEFTGDMKDAVESAFSAASSPEVATTTTVETPAPSASETATTDVTQAAQSTTTQTEPGPIPYMRFKEVNDKAGTLAKELETLAWAKGTDPQLARGAIELLTRAQQNPLAWTEELEALKDHPTLGPQLRSWAARTLGTRQASRQVEPDVDTEPMPDLQFEDGRMAYSAEQQKKREQWLLREWDSRIDAKIEPLAKRGQQTDQYVAGQVYAGIKTQAEATATSSIDALSKQYPQFNDHRKDVGQVMADNPSYTLEQAWAKVFVEKVGPKLAGQQAATVTRKLDAGTANPSRPSGAQTAVPDNFKDHLAMLMNS